MKPEQDRKNLLLLCGPEILHFIHVLQKNSMIYFQKTEGN